MIHTPTPNILDMFSVGLVAGSFDILHPGYIHLLRYASNRVGRLVVALQEDPSADGRKKHKPIFSWVERADALRALRFVDQVIAYKTEEQLEDLIRRLKPDIRFLGEDYRDRLDQVTGAHLAPIVFIDRSHGWSATKVREVVCQQCEQ